MHHESTNEPGGAKCPGKGFYPDESRTLFLVCWLPLLKSSRTGRAGLFFRAQRSACSRDSATPSTHETDEAVSPMAPSPAATALVDPTLTRPHGLPDRSTYGRRPHRRAAHRGQSDGQWGQPLQAFHAACRSAPVATQRQALLAQHWRPRGVTLPRGQALLVDERDSGGPGLGAFRLRRAPRPRVRPRGDDERTTPALQRQGVAVTAGVDERSSQQGAPHAEHVLVPTSVAMSHHRPWRHHDSAAARTAAIGSPTQAAAGARPTATSSQREAMVTRI